MLRRVGLPALAELAQGGGDLGGREEQLATLAGVPDRRRLLEGRDLLGVHQAVKRVPGYAKLLADLACGNQLFSLHTVILAHCGEVAI